MRARSGVMHNACMAGGKGDTWATDILSLVLNAVATANIADNAASSPLTALFVSLHSADPGHGGSQTTNELSYTGYARVSISRSSGSPAWTVTGPGGGGQAVNAGTVTWPACTGGSGTAAWFGVGTLVSGAGLLLYRGQITSPSGGLAISNGITPSSPGGDLVITEA